MGTLVRSGRGEGVVVGTGVQSEFGVVFSMMQEVRRALSLSRPRSRALTAARTSRLTLALAALTLRSPAGRRQEDAATDRHGRARQAVVGHLVRRHRCHLPHRRPAEAQLARDVHHRRCVPSLLLHMPAHAQADSILPARSVARRRRHPRRLAHRRNRHARARRPAHVEAQRHRQEAAQRRDARQRERHLLGQDGCVDSSLGPSSPPLSSHLADAVPALQAHSRPTS